MRLRVLRMVLTGLTHETRASFARDSLSFAAWMSRQCCHRGAARWASFVSSFCRRSSHPGVIVRVILSLPEAPARLRAFKHDGRRRRTAKDLKLPGRWLVRRNLRSFAVLRRHSTRREGNEYEWRLRLSQDDTNLSFAPRTAPKVATLLQSDSLRVILSRRSRRLHAALAPGRHRGGGRSKDPLPMCIVQTATARPAHRQGVLRRAPPPVHAARGERVRMAAPAVSG